MFRSEYWCDTDGNTMTLLANDGLNVSLSWFHRWRVRFSFFSFFLSLFSFFSIFSSFLSSFILSSFDIVASKANSSSAEGSEAVGSGGGAHALVSLPISSRAYKPVRVMASPLFSISSWSVSDESTILVRREPPWPCNRGHSLSVLMCPHAWHLIQRTFLTAIPNGWSMMSSLWRQ